MFITISLASNLHHRIHCFDVLQHKTQTHTHATRREYYGDAGEDADGDATGRGTDGGAGEYGG